MPDVVTRLRYIYDGAGIDQAGRGLDGLTTKTNAAGKSLAGMAAPANTAFSAIDSGATKASTSLSGVQSGAGKASTSLTGVQGSAVKTATSLAGVQGGAAAASTSLLGVGAGATQAAAGMTSAQASAVRTTGALGGVRGAALGAAGGLAAMARVVLPLTAAVAVVKGISDVIGTAASFEQQMNILQAVTGATAEDMSRLDKESIKLGADLTLPATSALDAARAMTELSKAGLSVSDTLAAAKGTLSLAAAANVSEARAAEIASNALNAFRLSGDQASRVADLLAAAANASSGEITDMADSMQMSSAVFSSLGFNIDELTTAIALMANRGIKGSDAGTSLKQAMLALINPTAKAKKELANMGVSLRDSSGAIKPLRTLIQDFTRASEKMGKAQRDTALDTIFGSDAIRAAFTVIIDGVDQYDEMYDAVTRVGAAQDFAAARTKGLAGAWEGLKSQLETLALVAGRPLLAGLTLAVSGVSSALQGALGFIERFQENVRNLGFGGAILNIGSELSQSFSGISIPDLGNKVLDALRIEGPKAIQALAGLASGVLSWATANGPTMAGDLTAWIISEGIPKAVGAIAAMVQAIIDQTPVLLPKLFEFGATLGAEIIRGLASGFDKLIAQEGEKFQASGLGRLLAPFIKLTTGAPTLAERHAEELSGAFTPTNVEDVLRAMAKAGEASQMLGADMAAQGASAEDITRAQQELSTFILNSSLPDLREYSRQNQAASEATSGTIAPLLDLGKSSAAANREISDLSAGFWDRVGGALADFFRGLPGGSQGGLLLPPARQPRREMPPDTSQGAEEYVPPPVPAGYFPMRAIPASSFQMPEWEPMVMPAPVMPEVAALTIPAPDFTIYQAGFADAQSFTEGVMATIGETLTVLPKIPEPDFSDFLDVFVRATRVVGRVADGLAENVIEILSDMVENGIDAFLDLTRFIANDFISGVRAGVSRFESELREMVRVVEQTVAESLNAFSYFQPWNHISGELSILISNTQSQLDQWLEVIRGASTAASDLYANFPEPPTATPIPSPTAPAPVFVPTPTPPPYEQPPETGQEGFQTLAGQFRRIPGAMNEPTPIIAHGQEIIGRPSDPFQLSQPDTGITPSGDTTNNVTINISGPFTGPITVTNDADVEQVGQTIAQKLLDSLEGVIGQGTAFPHALNMRA